MYRAVKPLTRAAALAVGIAGGLICAHAVHATFIPRYLRVSQEEKPLRGGPLAG
jgi:hypothetical protein